MQLPKDQKYTYADYLTWPDTPRYELIDGEPYLMAPAPTTNHQRVIGNLFYEIRAYLKGKTCEVFVAPFDVRITEDTVVQPDITVVCDPSKLDKAGLQGAPDMVVEVLSPASLRHDQVTKLNRYRKAGVREYWMISPEGRTVQVFLLENGKYVAQGYTEEDTVRITVLENLSINLRDVFPPEEKEAT